MDRNLTYIVPLAVLSLVGGAVQAWNTLHPRHSTSAGRTEEPPILAPAAVVHAPEGKGEPIRLSPEGVARGLPSAAPPDASARELSRTRRWMQEQRERLRHAQERSRAEAQALERGRAEARALERSRDALERSRAEQRRLREQLADREESARLLRRQVALLEALIQAWEDSAPAGSAAAAPADPARSSVWEARGRRFTLRGFYRQASEAFCRALWLNPADPILHYNLGLLCEEVLGEPGRALYHYGRFLALAPEGAQASRVRQRAQRLAEGN